ncbi:MAG: aminotransferase [Hyphococcus sp.]|nr:MAG: aminotransferase [Marinicaulis sp.]
MSNVSRIPLAIPVVGPEEGANLQKCIEDNFVSSVGPFVTEFEARVSALSGAAHGVAMGAGTQALHLALHCLGVGRGDLVALPSFTFIASANAIAHTGARPWLFDIDADSWTMSATQLAEALAAKTEKRADGLYHRESGERVAAIMPVYTLGTPADMDEIGKVAREFGLPVVADAAAAIGLTYNGKKLGALADLTCYSFNGNKTITCGGGGMVVGDDDALMQRIRHVSTTARVLPNYEHDEVGYNYRMTNLQAAVGCAQAEKLTGFLEAKKRIRKTYNSAFSGRNDVTPFPSPADRQSTDWFSGFALTDAASLTAAELCTALQTKRIEARPFWMPVHLQPPYADCPREDQSLTDDVWRRIVTLPCSTNLTETDQCSVIEAVIDILEGNVS